MSVLFSYKNCYLISHEKFINKIYSNVAIESDSKHSNEKRTVSVRILSAIFDLNSQYRNQKNENENRQRKVVHKKKIIEINDNQEEHQLIQRIKAETADFIIQCYEKGLLSKKISKMNEDMDNSNLKSFLCKWKTIEEVPFKVFNGGNTLETPLIANIDGTEYVIPANCKFFNGDISNISNLSLKNEYDLIVIDPPWWNKYVRRTKRSNPNNGYQMLDNNAIEKIPIENFVIPHRTLVAIWCTNAPSAIKSIKERFLSKWKLKLISTWYWIKITKSGDTICDFGLPLKKQPFERVFIACHNETTQYDNIPNEKFIFSIPSAIHSHKPPLNELIAPFMMNTSEPIMSLEIFARYLLPNTTSIGFEVLKLQNLELFISDRL